MSFVGKNNAKITNRPSGGGNKKQGLAPKATFFFISPCTGLQYNTRTGDFRGKYKLAFVNQVGGVGTFSTRNNADYPSKAIFYIQRKNHCAGLPCPQFYSCATVDISCCNGNVNTCKLFL